MIRTTMWRLGVVVSTLVVVLSGVGAPAQAERNRHGLTFLGTLGGGLSWPLDINDDGVVVGYSETGVGGEVHAFLWDGTLHDLGAAGPGDSSVALDVSETGVVAGSSGASAVYWEDGTLHVLPLPPGHGSANARAVNDLGVIVGQSHISEPPGFTTSHATVWDHGAIRLLPHLLPQFPGSHLSAATGINNRGQIVGYSQVTPSGLLHAVLWENGTVRDLGALPGDFFSYTDSINEDGLIAGYSSGDGGSTAVVWENGELRVPRLFGRFPNSQAAAANERGQIAGTVWTAESGCCTAVLAKPDKGKVVTIRELAFTEAVNNRGQVVGVDTSGPAYQGFIWQR